MNDTAKLGVALVGGYLLGRSKKAKTAVGLAMWLAGSRYNVRPRDLAREGVVRLAKSPQAARIGDEVRGPLLDASRRAARAAVEGQLGNITSALQRRTEALGSVGDKAAGKAKEGSEAVTGKGGGHENDMAEDQETPVGKREKGDVPGQRDRSSGRRPAERAAGREPKATPRGAKKAESRSKPAKSAASKGSGRSKAPAKKAASKSTAGSRGRSASSGSTTRARGSRSTSRSR